MGAVRRGEPGFAVAAVRGGPLGGTRVGSNVTGDGQGQDPDEAAGTGGAAPATGTATPGGLGVDRALAGGAGFTGARDAMG
jgi:hypothetical protein